MKRVRQQKSPELRRADILQASEKLFIAHGINDTRIEDIAKQADIGKGTLYLYFKNKEDILLGLGQLFLDYFVERLEFHRQACQTDDLANLLDAWLAGCLDAFYDKAQLHQLVFHHSPKRPLEHRHDNPAVKLLAKLLSQHQQPEPEFLANIMFNIVHGAVDFAFSNPPAIKKQTLFKQVCPILAQLITC